MIDQYIPKIQLKSKSSPPWISGEIIYYATIDSLGEI
jgi:hypothetical protein